MTTDPELTDPYTVNLNLELTETPPGKYLVKVVDLRLATGPSGYAYYDAQFVVQEPLQYSGCRLNTILSFAPRSLRWTIRRLEAMAGHELARDTVDLLDQDFRAQFCGRLVVLRVGSRLDLQGMSQPDVEAIYEVPQDGTLDADG